MVSSSSSTMIEHVVLFNVRDDATKSEIHSMVEQTNSLVSLQHPLHLTAGPLLRIRSSSSFLNFTHILHSRFSSKDDLQAYAVHPSHVAVINANMPLIADSMALDWVVEVHGDAALVPPPGSALRVTFFKLKEGLGEQVKDEVLKAIRVIQHDEHQQSIQLTCGENFSPARSKGFSIASLAVFSELQAPRDDEEEFGNFDEIKEHLESVLVFDYVPEGHS